MQAACCQNIFLGHFCGLDNMYVRSMRNDGVGGGGKFPKQSCIESEAEIKGRKREMTTTFVFVKNIMHHHYLSQRFLEALSTFSWTQNNGSSSSPDPSRHKPRTEEIYIILHIDVFSFSYRKNNLSTSILLASLISLLFLSPSSSLGITNTSP